MNTHHTPPNPPTQPDHEQEESAMTYWPTTPDDHRQHTDGDRLHNHAETVYDAIRAMCHHTTGRPVLPAPDLYRILGEFHAAPLAQLLRQLANGLGASADHYQLYEHDPARSPSTSICLAVGHLADAARAAAELSRHLTAAQAAINGQGHHGPIESSIEGEQR
ncbi:MAG: hypothetical protein ACRCYU_17835 [Nocardioides sp.]